MITFIFLGVILGLSEGAGVLPDGPLNAFIGETVWFNTTLNPAEKPFLSVGWSYGVEQQIITSSSDKNTTAPEYEGRITLFRSTASLELRNVNLSDSGEYRLNILPADDFAKTGHTTLNVYELVSVEIIPSSANAAEFSSFSFFCSSSGSDLSFLWLNGSSEITASDKVQINTTIGGSYMTIVNVTRFDQGTYWCHGSNPISSNNVSASLNVSYGPENIELKVFPSKDHYDEESEVTMRCSAESVPPAEFSWFQNGAELPSTGAQLILSNIQMSHHGNYSCKAFNNKTLRHQTSQPIIINVKKNPVSSGLSAGVIAGIVIACLAVLAAVGGGGYYIYRKKGRELP